MNDQITAWALGELPPAELAAVEVELDANPHCGRSGGTAQLLSGSGGKLPAQPGPDGCPARLGPRVLPQRGDGSSEYSSALAGPARWHGARSQHVPPWGPWCGSRWAIATGAP